MKTINFLAVLLFTIMLSISATADTDKAQEAKSCGSSCTEECTQNGCTMNGIECCK